MATKTRLPMNGEKLETLKEIARHYPSTKNAAKRMHPATLTRRILKGCRSLATGRIVRLEAIREGPRWLTSWEAIERFHAKLAAPVDEETQAEEASDRAIEAGKILERMGA
jgi:hypothetical protein